MSATPCPHVPRTIAEARGIECERCGSGVNVRLCTHCGFVGCCESQHGHNREHALAAKHPVIKQLPLNDASFTWCYDCDAYV